MKRALTIAAAFALLGACEITPEGEVRGDARLDAATHNAFAAWAFDLPFAAGSVYVVAPREGEMVTFKLVPCRDGTRICGGSPHGPAGHLRRGADFYEVRGAYPGRDFYLSPNGDGYLRRGNTDLPLAWATEAPLDASSLRATGRTP